MTGRKGFSSIYGRHIEEPPMTTEGRNINPKIVLHHTDAENLQRCFVGLFQRYCSFYPPDAPPHAFYLQLSWCPTSSCWYSNRPLGHTGLGKTVSSLCKEAGLMGSEPIMLFVLPWLAGSIRLVSMSSS